MKRAVAVVGGGLAGLAAALECADARRRRDALRGALAARRRDVLVRAQRPRARQRPARRAPLLHRVPRLPAPARRRRACSRSSGGCASRSSARGSRPRSISRSGAPAPAPPRRDAAPLRAARPRASGSSAARAATRARQARPGRPRARRPTFARLAARRTASRENAIDALWNLIALPTLNLPADEASLAGAVEGLPHGPARRAPTPPTSASRRCRSGGCTPSPRPAALEARRRPARSPRTPVRVGRRAERELALDDGADRRRRGDPRGPARRRRRSRARRARSTPRRSAGSARARS